MSIAIAHLGPTGTYAEQATLAYADWVVQTLQIPHPDLQACPTIAQTLQGVAAGKTELAVVPVENSIEGSVTVTLDTLWQMEQLQIQQALVLPIVNNLVSQAPTLEQIQVVYSHPQPLAQCRQWLETHLPQAQLIPTNSTTEALQRIESEVSIAAIASQRAAELYRLPILVPAIQDYPDNCTRFWVVSRDNFSFAKPLPHPGKTYTSMAFSLPRNAPGALVKPLQIFASRSINLSRIESRPSKRSLGDYVFFIDAEASLADSSLRSALSEIAPCTEVFKVFGSYGLISINASS